MRSVNSILSKKENERITTLHKVYSNSLTRYTSKQLSKSLEYNPLSSSSYIYLFDNSDLLITDVNECDKPELCNRNSSICLNIEGSYTCQCKQGYDRVSNLKCVGKILHSLAYSFFLVKNRWSLQVAQNALSKEDLSTYELRTKGRECERKENNEVITKPRRSHLQAPSLFLGNIIPSRIIAHI